MKKSTSAPLGGKEVAETSNACWREKKRTENGMQQATVTIVKKTETVVNASNLFVGGLSQLDSPSFTGVNKVLTIAFVT